MQDCEDAIPDSNPFDLFEAWFAEARASEPNDANAMALATATSDGVPSVRMVLLKEHGRDGFVFYTNAESRKGQEILANPQAALLFHWKSLRRQVRIEGPLLEVTPEMADDYFHSRARDWSEAAEPICETRALDRRATYLARVEDIAARYPEGTEIPRPPHWTGFRLTPDAMEFWIDREHRLHERRRFASSGEGWASSLLYP